MKGIGGYARRKATRCGNIDVGKKIILRWILREM
jgi:hypothetical protein